MMGAYRLHGDPVLPEALLHLRELALNLRWTWDRGIRALFHETNPEFWDRTEDNPWLMLQAASPLRLEMLANDAGFRARLDEEYQELQRYMAERAWFPQAHPEEGETVIAYFTAECGLTECLPIYAGGLGILSGDHLKAASALGVPLVGVSLLYQQGYSRQMLDEHGWQHDRFPSNDFHSMPLQIERDAEGWPLVVPVPLPGRPLSLQVWRAQVGRVSLYLLDANIPLNNPADRGVTDELYGGDRTMRLQQEMALGIGGWRALTAIGLKPGVCHLNEGHAAFALLERARQQMEEARCSFWEALAATTAGNVFTTHTPVPAGFDLFAPDLIARYFAPYAVELGISVADLIGLGRVDPRNANEPFNMALLALRHVNSCNGVSQLHAQVSRRLFRPWFPRFPDREIPVSAVTNGIHTASWVAEAPETLLRQYLGPAVIEQPDQADWGRGVDIPDHELWQCLRTGRQRLVEFARDRLRRQLGQRGVPAEEAAARAEGVLDPNVLTLGFARRFAAYKRPALFLRDADRLRRLLLDPERPIQLVIAGKAHPQDDAGKALIQQVVQFAQGEDVRHRIVFLEDYDMKVTGRLVQGVDVWLNTPRRPMEASGTSGMKVLPNGGLNLSVRDGWWAEAYEAGLGWAFGTEAEGMGPGQQDALDAGQLYETLEREVIPLFYDRSPEGTPHGWIAMVKRSMRKLCPQFNTNRMVRQYVEEHYLPAARRYRALTAGDLAGAKSLAAWEAAVRTHWGEIRILDFEFWILDCPAAAEASVAGTSLSAQSKIQNPKSKILCFRAHVHLGALHPDDVAAQLYAEPLDGAAPEMVPMQFQPGEGGDYVVKGQVPAHRSPGDYTVRLLPRHPEAATRCAGTRPLELPLVLWEH